MKYVPYSELDGIPNVIVDGPGHKDSVFVLSHWSNSGTSPTLIRDTSTEIVFDYLDQNVVPDHVLAVSNNHFDQDGLASIFALVQPELAQRHRTLLIDVAEAGDFGKYRDDKAAKIAILINTITTPEAGYFEQSVFSLPYAESSAIFYREALKLLPKALEDVDAYRALWEEEYAFLSRSVALIEAGQVIIEEDVENDIAIITTPANLGADIPMRFKTAMHFGGIHEFAIHNATRCARLFQVHDKQIQFKYRYETWVQLKNNTHPLRIDLSPLAVRLSELDSVKWNYEGSTELVPLLGMQDNSESALPPGEVLSMLKRELQSGEVDWNPYPDSSSSPPNE